MTSPLRFCFGLHLHQPVDNFDSVFEQHLSDVYDPLLAALETGAAWPVAMHLSGPLLDWLEARAPRFLDRLGEHAAAGRLELLCAGYDEPILAVLPRDDRIEQVERHRSYLRSRFGVDAVGLWLTERVWEPGLVEDLATAGVEFVLVDDRHFRVTGFTPEQLHAHYATESGGHRVRIFPIDERLRYLVPFRPPEELADYFAQLRAGGHALAVLADDGEKFGGWPGTRKWVYEAGWMSRFLATLRTLGDAGAVQLSRFDAALAATPSAGLAYLPSASYREMEGWSLPVEPARELLRLERDWGEARLAGIDGGLLRGGHWRNFLAKYPESNRMHKWMLALSAACRAQGNPAEARRAIGRAQCNDAYWHGVFGGLYLPILRAPIWKYLARAEALLRRDAPLVAESLDFDADGHLECWVHDRHRSTLIAPARGGAVEGVLDFALERNWVDVMSRYREAYHEPLTAGIAPAADGGGMPSIHDLEGALEHPPPRDLEPRALFVDRVVATEATREDFVAGVVPVLHSWAGEVMPFRLIAHADRCECHLQGSALNKVIVVDSDGSLSCDWSWDPDAFAAGAWFTTELSSALELAIDAPGAEQWDYPIETVAKSERGFDHTVQGTATVLRWGVATGSASVTIRAAAAARAG